MVLNINQSILKNLFQGIKTDTISKNINNDIFKMPIEYVNTKHSLQQSIIDDLELTQVRDISSTKPLYNYLFNPQTSYGEKMIPYWSKYFTTDKDFLNETRELLTNYSDIKLETDKIDVFTHKWNDIHADDGFDSKYFYVDIKPLSFLNNYPLILQGLSIYNFGAPFFSLLIPVFIFIVPFFILKAMCVPITIGSYKEILYNQLKNQAIIRLFSNEGTSIQSKLYLLFSVVMYIFNIYQNVTMCIKFYKNFNYIFDFLNSATSYLNYIKHEMEKLNNFCTMHSVYKSFSQDCHKVYNILTHYLDRIYNLQPLKFSLTKFGYIGQIMKIFYEFKHNPVCISSINYSILLFGYLDNIKGIRDNIYNKVLSFGDIIDESSKKSKEYIKGIYYPSLLKSSQCVKNDIKMNKNYIISGPNASGKTTLLKTILANIIFTQQVSCGFYSKYKVKPYHNLHCYLNIPDTSGRDSLFQAEARRCKDIIDYIHNDTSRNHFCIFDELYSGTNPYEAVGSAYSYLLYLSKYNNVKLMITTHFINLCEALERKSRKYLPIQMNTEIINGVANYKYKIIQGISKINCGARVLRQLNYPPEILEKISSFSFN